MVEVLQVSQGELRIGWVERHRLLASRVDADCLCHLSVFSFVRVDALGGMQVECCFQAKRVQKADEAGWIGEQLSVPGIACPAGSGVAGLGNVPVHIDDTYREGYVPFTEIEHQLSQLILRICPIATPPVAQRPARH